MPVAKPDQSYDAIPDFGTLYDSVPAYISRADVDFYVEEATRAGSPVLELGCGTGRILLPMARSGLSVVGIDSSAEMLARCRGKLLAEPDAVRSRVELHPADVRGFELDKTFGCIIAPFRVLQHLVTIDDQLRCLGAVARHLKPGGRFVFDVFNPWFDKLVAADGVEHEETPLQRLPDGRTLRRAFRVARVRWLEQTNEVELIYYVSPADGKPEQRFVHGFDMRWYLRAELEHLLSRAGFRVGAIHGDFDRSPLTDPSPDVVVVAERLA